MLSWWSIGTLLLRKGETDGAIGAFERGLRICDQWGFHVWYPRLASSLGLAYVLTGRKEEGLPLAQEAVRRAEHMGLVVDMAMLLIRLGQTSLAAGRIEEALSLGKSALDLALAHEAKGDEAWARFLLARACWAASPRNIDEAAQQLDIALRIALDNDARPLAAYAQMTLGGVYELRGDQAKAQELTAAANATYAALGMRQLPQDPVR